MSSKQFSVKLLKYECVSLNDYLLRSLISESSHIFKSIQRLEQKKGFLSKEELIRNSRKYRSVIHSNYAKAAYLSNSKDESLNQTFEKSKDMLLKIEMVWSLCEFLFVDINSPGLLLSQLLTWIRWHFPEIVQQTEQLLNKEKPYEDEKYWSLIIGLVLKGEMKSAKNLLKLNPAFENDDNLTLIANLLNSMPIFTKDQILYEFFMKWQAWSVQCKLSFNENIFNTQEEKNLVGILAGDLNTFKNMTHHFNSWYHLMIALILFTDPLLKETTLSSFSKECLTIFYGTNQKPKFSNFDEILIHAFAYDLMSVIQESCLAFQDNWWFVSHFIDLLYNGNQLDSNEIEEPKSLREFFLLDYANSLMEQKSLWYLAVDYFNACPEYGMEYLRANLEKVSIDNEVKALKIINIAEKHEFNELRRSVATVMARKWLSKGRLGSALIWAVKSKSPMLTSYISDCYLKKFAETKQFPDEDVLGSLGPLMLISDRLTFLAKYYEFNELKKRGMLEEASIQLENLITSKIAPKFFILTLLMDSIPLLEAESLILNGDQTHQILMALENYSNLARTEADKDPDCDEKENYLRLAIARNMARAMIFA